MTEPPPAPCDPSLDDIERAHDGPLPPGVLARLRFGPGWECGLSAAILAHHARQADHARAAAALRRADLPAATAPADPWLSRLAATVAHHRAGAIGGTQPS